MRRIGKLELLRFLASMMIIDGHISVLIGEVKRPFCDTWNWVEFFFILTSVFTIKHFNRAEYITTSWETKAKNSVTYTIKKFKKFIPYTTLPIILMYILQNWKKYEVGIRSLVKSFENMPIEVCYLSAATKEGTTLAPLWFLSAMMIIFPLFVLICQSQHRKIITLLGGVYNLIILSIKI